MSDSFWMPRLGRRSVLGVLALSGVGVAAGCAKGSEVQAGSTDGDGGGSFRLTLQNADVQSADPATWAIVQAFQQEHADITVEVSGQAVAEHLQSISIAAQSDTLPDMFWVYDATARELLAADRLLDLSGQLAELGIIDRLPPTTVQSLTSEGVTYGVPYQTLLTGLWYNEKILHDSGLQLPTTFEDLLGVATELSDAGMVTISNGANQSSFSVWQFLVWLSRFGFEDRIAGILDGSDRYDNPDFIRMYTHIAELRDAGAFASNVSTQTYQQAVDRFLNGKAAMLDAGVWAAGAIQDSGVAEHTGFWIGPTFADGVGEQNIVMNVPSAPLVVDHKVGDNPARLELIKKFLDFYYGDAAQQLMVENGQPPVTGYQPQLDPEQQRVLKSALDAAAADGVTSPRTQPDLAVSTTIANTMYDSIYGVIQGQLDPQAAVELVQTAVDRD